ncbi:MAG: hypothetical protein EHM53_06325 [Methanoregulaceae archaeon]|nr:MAG: hypothetical protein EHM53_06325 [Methanoregulaceae archaeon]
MLVGVNSSFMPVSIEHFFYNFSDPFPAVTAEPALATLSGVSSRILITPQRFISWATACIHAGFTGCPGRQIPARVFDPIP